MTVEGVLALGDSYVTYILSFFWLGTMWVGLHNEWHHIRVINKKVVWLGIALLFVTSWIPYSMSVVAAHPMNRLAQILYGMSVLLVTLVNLWLSVSLYRCHFDLEECEFKPHMRVLRLRYIPDIAVKIIGMILSGLVYAPAMIYAVLVSMIWTLIPLDKILHHDKKEAAQ